jgi:hypothetical protein
MAGILAGLGGIMGAVGSIQAGNAKASSEYSNANAADYNAAVERQRAATALEQGSAREEIQRRQDRQTQGRMTAAIGEAGIVGTTGSAALVQQESAVNTEYKSLTTLYESDLQAKGLTDQANLDNMQATQYRKNARAARTAGYLAAGASLLSSAAQYSGGQTRVQTAQTGGGYGGAGGYGGVY